MPATRTFTNFTWATGSASASGTTNPIACASDYGREVYASLAQGGAPTAGAAFTVRWSPDGSTWYNGPTFSFGNATATFTATVDVPISAVAVSIVYTAQTGGSSSALTAQLAQVTGI